MPMAWQGGKLQEAQAMGLLWVRAIVPGQGEMIMFA